MSWFDENTDEQQRAGGPPVPGTPPRGTGTPPGPAAPGGPSQLAVRYPTIVQAYQKALGRTPSDQEILSQTGGGTFGTNDPRLQMSVGNIYNGPEAQDYAKRSAATPAAATTTGTGDPARDAVVAAFAKKGVTPNAGEVDYWVGKINDTGGYTGDNKGYWDTRMAQDQGGVGDRQGRPETGSNGTGLADSSLLQPFTEQFKAPDAITEQNDPGFQARLSAANDALQRSAAAKGTVLTGQTAKDLQEQSQTFATNEYDKVYGRALGEYQQRQATFYHNQDSPFAKLFSMAGLDSQNQIAANQLGLGYDTLNSNNANQANQLGFNWANLYANTTQNGANQYNGYLTSGANATSAGQIARGNTWGNLWGNQIPSAVYGAYYSGQPVYNPNPGH